MPARELLLATVLLFGGSLVVVGVAQWSIPSAYIVAGLLIAAIGCLFLVEAD